MRAPDGSGWRELELPPADAFVMPGIVWGGFDEICTPAFWAGQAWLHAPTRRFESYRLGTSLREEIAACLLGGHGIPGEIGVAAFQRLRTEGLLDGTAQASTLEAALSSPLTIGTWTARYRFARQKARYLAEALARVDDLPSDARGRALRNALCGYRGIGPKTASWIARNWSDADDVAILDVHVCRACERAGVFAVGADPQRNYYDLEMRFLDFAEAIAVRPSVLDNLIWNMMRRLSPALERLGRATTIGIKASDARLIPVRPE